MGDATDGQFAAMSPAAAKDVTKRKWRLAKSRPTVAAVVAEYDFSEQNETTMEANALLTEEAYRAVVSDCAADVSVSRSRSRSDSRKPKQNAQFASSTADDRVAFRARQRRRSTPPWSAGQ